jgi:hypothetical protein
MKPVCVNFERGRIQRGEKEERGREERGERREERGERREERGERREERGEESGESGEERREREERKEIEENCSPNQKDVRCYFPPSFISIICIHYLYYCVFENKIK